MQDNGSKTTKDHEVIKQWAEARDAKPSVVKSTHDTNEGAGILRFNFPGYSGADSLEEISWEEFFDTFDKKELTFLYQDEKTDGEQSTFCKFIKDAS